MSWRAIVALALPTRTLSAAGADLGAGAGGYHNTNLTNARHGALMTKPRTSNAVLSSEEQKNLICGILADFAADPDVEVLLAYLRHCGLPLTALHSAKDVLPAFLGLYRIRPGLYDVERACMDLRFWPPVAARVAELMAEEEAKRQHKPKRKSTQRI